MKISIRRLLALLLALVLVLSLSPTALLANTGEGEGNQNQPSADADRLTISLYQGSQNIASTNSSGQPTNSNGLRMTGPGRAPDIRVTMTARDASGNDATNAHNTDRIAWTSDREEVAVPHDISGDGRLFYVEGVKPGIATITGVVTAADGSSLNATGTEISFKVTVSGILPLQSTISIEENRSRNLPQISEEDAYREGNDPFGIVYFGDAANGTTISITSDRGNVALATGTGRDGLYVDGVTAGTAIVTISTGNYSASITVDVQSNEAEVIKANASASEPLKLATLEATIAEQCLEMIEADGDKSLVYITGLSVPTAQGTIYLGYNSPDDTGSGAGSALNYYASSQPRGPYIKDLTFVPNQSYTGEKATITFTGRAVNNRTFKGKIEVTIEDTHTDVILTTRADVPLDLASEDFAKVCQEQTGSSLSYVRFTLPPASQGVLYRDYKNVLDYGSRVTAAEQYDRKGLDDVTFVPAEGFVGQVTIGYAGYSTTGARYNGQLVINVTRPLDESIHYQDHGAGEIAFSGSDFDAYSVAMTGEAMRTAGHVSFTLPPASQGALYYRRSGRDTPVPVDNSYTLSQLDSIVFVAANGFNDVVRIPFTGTDRYGVEFSGTVELHLQATTALNGDIRYTCQPDQSVKLQVTDFANLCQSVTGQRLYYVAFQRLPDYTQGALFYNRTSSGVIGTRVSTAAKYFNSANPYLNNVSFWASKSFSSVEIPFTLTAVDGQTFSGLLVISNGEGNGGGRAGTVTYTTSGQQPVTFTGSSFDAACRQATNAALNYLHFSLPSSGQGILYYDYNANTTPRAFDPSTTLYLTGNTSIDKVTFVPAKGFSGVASVPFTAVSINGTTYQGTVEITVRAGAAYGSIVRYSTGGAPVHIQSNDVINASGIGQLSSVRLTGLPNANQGRIYYQYTSPTQYSWLGNTTTVYSVTGDPSVSNLTFIPKAGYQGVVTVPYAATAIDGTSAQGTIEITITLPESSLDFDDMGGFSAETKAAVDYLSSQGVVNGTSYRTYNPGASIWRGDFCLMVSRAFRFNVGGSGQGFDDVPANHYYTQAINEMYALGIVNGVGGGLFRPETTITRQDAAVMVCRALDKAGITLPQGSDQAALANYRDRNQVDAYAQEALASLVRAGYFPVSGNRLNPKAAITRADMALLLHRAMTSFN